MQLYLKGQDDSVGGPMIGGAVAFHVNDLSIPNISCISGHTSSSFLTNSIIVATTAGSLSVPHFSIFADFSLSFSILPVWFLFCIIIHVK
jgi:hypothetical protein